MAKRKVTLNQLAEKHDELMGFLKDNMVMRGEMKAYPTKDDLKEECKAYPTKDDLKRELQNYATKDDLKQVLQNYPTKDDLRWELQNYATKNDMQEFRQEILHEVLTVSDQVAKLQQMIEVELIAPTLRMDRMDGRLCVVETKLGIATP